MDGEDSGAGNGVRLGEGYPAHWQHCLIHLDPRTGTMHSDGDHRVRLGIERAVREARGERDEARAALRRLWLGFWLVFAGWLSCAAAAVALLLGG